eukprot:TRINITY_DN224_c0_g1_i10.p2 TRINITY_DN224_c0_g1~~TRINITY_DN224_c0_g1_i10.p2  ORF type:complete len:494 (-),score=66.40 TRINITY_DN224_c0_g1_i10:4706-6187(-)
MICLSLLKQYSGACIYRLRRVIIIKLIQRKLYRKGVMKRFKENMCAYHKERFIISYNEGDKEREYLCELCICEHLKKYNKNYEHISDTASRKIHNISDIIKDAKRTLEDFEGKLQERQKVAANLMLESKNLELEEIVEKITPETWKLRALIGKIEAKGEEARILAENKEYWEAIQIEIEREEEALRVCRKKTETLLERLVEIVDKNKATPPIIPKEDASLEELKNELEEYKTKYSNLSQEIQCKTEVETKNEKMIEELNAKLQIVSMAESQQRQEIEAHKETLKEKDAKIQELLKEIEKLNKRSTCLKESPVLSPSKDNSLIVVESGKISSSETSTPSNCSNSLQKYGSQVTYEECKSDYKPSPKQKTTDEEKRNHYSVSKTHTSPQASSKNHRSLIDKKRSKKTDILADKSKNYYTIYNSRSQTTDSSQEETLANALEKLAGAEHITQYNQCENYNKIGYILQSMQSQKNVQKFLKRRQEITSFASQNTCTS